MFDPSKETSVKIFFAVFLSLNVLCWFYVRDVKAQWLNIPPVPTEKSAAVFALGDEQLAYRTIGIMLQNLGDTGGRSTSLDEYNYDELTRWFFLSDKLDPRSNFTPFLASFYFGAVKDPQKLSPITDYLQEVGTRPDNQKWRFLAHAVYLARFQMKDLDRALELAHTLAKVEVEDLPGWAKKMPAFVLTAQGNKQEALDIMLETLKSSSDKIHPNEVNATRDYICTRLLDEAEAKSHPLCQDIP